MKLSFTVLLSVAALLCSGVNANLTESEKETLLSLHRHTREEIGASDMKSISWSSSLASGSQSYADGCHGMNHSNTGPENLAQRGNRSVKELFNQWKDEKKAFFNSGVVNSYKSSHEWGHYSQIVWADTTKVGCGLAECSGSYYLVCRYDTGNVIGQKVFSGGKSSSSSESKKEEKEEHHHEEKKTTTSTRKTTTTTRKTTSTTTKVQTTTTTKVATTTIAVPTIKTLGTATKLVGTNTVLPLASGVKTVAAVPTAAAGATKGKKVAQKIADDEKAADSSKPIVVEEAQEEKKDDSSNTATSVAVTGSVVGAAAAAFVLLKKNPKQYDNLKRSLSRKASSVKRGASVVTRKLTTKRANPVPTTNTDAYNINYRIDFTETMQQA